MAKYRYQFTSQSFRQLEKLPKKTQKRIINKLDFFCKKNPLLYADKLTDLSIGSFRFRIGDWRVIFDLEEENTLTILLVGHRREIYR